MKSIIEEHQKLIIPNLSFDERLPTAFIFLVQNEGHIHMVMWMKNGILGRQVEVEKCETWNVEHL